MACDVHLHALPNGEKNTQLYYALYDISLLFIELFLFGNIFIIPELVN